MSILFSVNTDCEQYTNGYAARDKRVRAGGLQPLYLYLNSILMEIVDKLELCLNMHIKVLYTRIKNCANLDSNSELPLLSQAHCRLVHSWPGHLINVMQSIYFHCYMYMYI